MYVYTLFMFILYSLVRHPKTWNDTNVADLGPERDSWCKIDSCNVRKKLNTRRKINQENKEMLITKKCRVTKVCICKCIYHC